VKYCEGSQIHRMNRTARLLGIATAAAVLGNSLGMVAEVYAETVFEKAIEAMREMG